MLLFLLLALSACGGTSSTQDGEQESKGQEAARIDLSEITGSDSTEPWATIEAVLSEDILSEEERAGPPEQRNWYEKSPGGEPVELPVSTSTGAVPAVRPFNFECDPGGPEDKTLYLSVSKLGVEDLPIVDSISEEKLKESATTSQPRVSPSKIGPASTPRGIGLDTRTLTLCVFYELDKLVPGDDTSLKDAAGDEYAYEVTEQRVVPPDDVEVMNAGEGESIVTLQSCTLPDYAECPVVQGDLAGELCLNLLPSRLRQDAGYRSSMLRFWLAGVGGIEASISTELWRRSCVLAYFRVVALATRLTWRLAGGACSSTPGSRAGACGGFWVESGVTSSTSRPCF